MRVDNSKVFLVAGFGFTILMMVVLIAIWALNITENKKNLSSILSEQKQSQLVIEMRDVARQRTIILHRMILLDDEFDRDVEYLKFKEMAGRFIAARQGLLLLSMEEEAGKGLEIWDRARFYIHKGESVQQQVLLLILDGEMDKANKLLLKKMIPIQNKVMDTLSEMLEEQKRIAQNAFDSSIVRNESISYFVFIVGSISILLTILTTIIVIRRTVATETSLHQARRDALSATEQKSQFLANMSHEIRSPLSAVLGYAEMLLETDVDNAERDEFTKKIMSSGQHLQGVINDILDFSKIEANQLTVEVLEVSTINLVLDVQALVQTRAEQKGLEFKVDFEFPLPSSFFTDPTRLRQILVNLCGNAIKFTEQGSVTLTIQYDSVQEILTFIIVDTGIGMTEEQQQDLFRAFSQADLSTTRKYGGTGLGLSISKQLSKMLGGDVYCNSQKDIGSQFTCYVGSSPIRVGRLS